MTDIRSTAERLREQGLDVETVGDILQRTKEPPSTGVEDRPDVAVTGDGSFVPPRLEGYPYAPLQPGLYFDLPEEVYHAIPALSNGGIKELAASPMLYWQNCRWMNPDWEEQEQKDHFDLGHAYECRILEPDVFDQKFAISLDKRDYPDALVTHKHIKDKLAEYGIDKCPSSKDAAFEKLVELDPDAQLWERIEAAHVKGNEGKTFIGFRDRKRIEIAARLVSRDEEQAVSVSGGHSQVTMVAHCPKTGVLRKARCDYLKIGSILDTKTMRFKGREITSAIASEIGARRYTFQVEQYLEVAHEVRALVKKHGASAIFGCEGIDDEGQPIIGPADPNRTEWALEWSSNKEPIEWSWLFIVTSPPITRLVHHPAQGLHKCRAIEIIEEMKKRFRRFAEVYDADPWLDLGPTIYLADEDLPPYATEV